MVAHKTADATVNNNKNGSAVAMNQATENYMVNRRSDFKRWILARSPLASAYSSKNPTQRTLPFADRVTVTRSAS